MADEPNLEAALTKLDKITNTIRSSQHGRTRPAFSQNVNDPTARVDRIEDAVLAIEEALRALRA